MHFRNGKSIPTKVKLLANDGPQSQDILDQFLEVSVGRQQLDLLHLENPYVIEFWKAAISIYPKFGPISGMDTGEVLKGLDIMPRNTRML